MREFLKSSGRRLGAASFWPLVLLALPTCGLQTTGIGGPPHFLPGDSPTSAVMCDIPKPGTSQCAMQGDDLTAGISTAAAAVVLNAGGSGLSTVFDFSQTNGCGVGLPQKTEFFGAFPEGLPVCVNCGTQKPAPYADNNAVCVAKCVDLLTFTPEPVGDAFRFCEAYAHVSTNFSKTTCFDGVCTMGGTPNFPNGFMDPRWTPENVKWTDESMVGVEATWAGNSLKRIADQPGTTSDFDAGAASGQLIRKGDAWVEFGAGQVDKGHVLGVRESCPDLSVCPDNDPHLNVIGFSIFLGNDHMVYVIESDGTSPTVFGPFGTYTVLDRFRVNVVDNNDGTATISYEKMTEQCMPGKSCAGTTFAQQVMPSPKYPLRVDASFAEKDALLTDVTIVRIQED